MTTAVKPLAKHGTTARAKGRPAQGVRGCSCAVCRKAEAVYDKKRRVLNATGRPYMVDATPAREHLQRLFQAGYGWKQIATGTGSSSDTIWHIVNGNRPKIRATVATRILTTTPESLELSVRSVPSVGTVRRAHALVALGHRVRDIAEAAGINYATGRYLVTTPPDTILETTAAAMVRAYKALSTTRGTCARSVNRAKQEGWAPPAAWDDDAIDDPSAVPDWTGFCGTDRGWRTHRQAGQAPCPRCVEAHTEWLKELHKLPEAERVRASTAARAVVRKRGAVIAENARELFEQGYDRRGAAERLGVTVDWLTTELIRNPVVDEQVAA